MRRFVNYLRRVRNRLYYWSAGGERRPVFLDVHEVNPGLLAIDRNFDVIAEELEAVLATRGRIPNYHEVDPNQTSISGADDKNWKAYFFHVHDDAVKLSNAKLCPRTAQIVASIPGALMAFFSILEPGKSVPAHEGPSYSYLRYHTAFKVPANDPPSIRVKDRRYTWKRGESLLFDDSWEHEVYNESDGERVVLIVDVMRPAPWLLERFNRFVIRLSAIGARGGDWERIDREMSPREA